MSEVIHVAAGVIYNAAGEVLLARRAEHRHQGGLWEFPGGKIEAGETVEQALARELHEEVGITVSHSEPLIRIPHDYADRRVVLDVRAVRAFSGEAHGREGQPVRWVAPPRLNDYAMPAANRPIVNALRLPAECLITPPLESEEQWLSVLKKSLQQGVRLVQLRLKELAADRIDALTRKALALCHAHGCQVLLNADPPQFAHLPVDGFHLPSATLSRYSSRPVAADKWLSASVHNRAELAEATRLEVDFAFVAPVQATRTHPDAVPLGWAGFAELADAAAFPVYALGGMQRRDVILARQYGGQGIAGIRVFVEGDA
ncbi:Nudix family hydrolase [Thiohalophilus sp.]|uniref:Nudix family hydrolase n=1 Tax=Thiohalophilus sp. TaxID=3028392 RepID=UPI002ACD5609|nr:Nudix family hydrolase [Thiohalophilus sp.]MDZ7662327.1 Nudix family hydrolase [Thiohalophilus sp.]MDZ7802410.1 Nudix family hydrolase [Thiohalophilus sp.]